MYWMGAVLPQRVPRAHAVNSVQTGTACKGDAVRRSLESGHWADLALPMLSVSRNKARLSSSTRIGSRFETVGRPGRIRTIAASERDGSGCRCLQEEWVRAGSRGRGQQGQLQWEMMATDRRRLNDPLSQSVG